MFNAGMHRKRHLGYAAMLLVLFVSFVLTSVASAELRTCPDGTSVPDGIPCAPIAPVAGATGPGFVFTILNNVISIAFYILMFLAVLFVLLAAAKYLTSQGNPEKVETAQRMLLYAVIAIVIAVLARSVPFIVEQFVSRNVAGGTGGSGSSSGLPPGYDPNSSDPCAFTPDPAACRGD